MRILTMTNATKANVIAAANAVMGILITFHAVLTTAQMSSIDVVLNAVLTLWIALTYRMSHKRIT